MVSPGSLDKPPQTLSRQRSRGRKLLLRGMSVLCGLSLFVAAELLCCFFGIGESRPDDDPFVGFNDLQPLFGKDETGNRFVTAQARLKFFTQEEFSATKSADTNRIFCLGGSTVKGRPFSKETSFTTWLQLALEQAQPNQNWEVINCGGISYASYRLTPILQECLAYEPDAFVICTGHNEFLEDRSYGEMKDVSPMLTVPFYGLSRLRSFRLLRNALLSDSEAVADGRDQLGSDVDAFLDYRNGLNAYHRDDSWRRGVVSHFETNLNRMVQLADTAGVPVIFVQPPSNLADSPPFKSEHRSGITASEIAAWQLAMEAAHSSMKKFPADAIRSLQEAIAFDDEYAETHYELGRLLELMGDSGAARDEFLLAREHDICPLRMITPLEQAMSRVAEQNRIPLLNAHALLEAKSREGILGSSMLVDHVHPSFEGHQIMAMALVRILQEADLVRPQNDWQDRAKESFNRHFELLPDIYFAKGEQNLANLRYWTQGLADGPPVESRPQQKAMSATHQGEP